MLDGEIVFLDVDGRCVFSELLYRRGNPCFYAFDLSWLNGKNLRQLPLLERKQALRRLIPKRRRGRVVFAQHIKGCGRDLFKLICQRDREGIVAKRKGAAYAPTTSWVKVKNRNYSQIAGRQELFEERRHPTAAPTSFKRWRKRS